MLSKTRIDVRNQRFKHIFYLGEIHQIVVRILVCNHVRLEVQGRVFSVVFLDEKQSMVLTAPLSPVPDCLPFLWEKSLERREIKSSNLESKLTGVFVESTAVKKREDVANSVRFDHPLPEKMKRWYLC